MAAGLISFSAGLRSGLRLGARELETLQLMRLKSLITHAYENVSYYRKLFDSVGFAPRHLKRLSDLEAIPVTSRQTLQKVPYTEMVARGSDPARLRKSQTSGSTGVPLHIYKTRRESRTRQLLTLRAFIHNGLRWNDRVLTLSHSATTPVERGKFAHRLFLGRSNVSFFEEPEKQLLRFLKIRPTVIYGYTASVAMLADVILKGGTNGIPLSLVATSSEDLLPGYRKAIQRAFGVEPLDIYNCTELGDIAWQCRQRSGFHINADWLRVELLRYNRPVAPGEIGEVVVTSLYRFAMPLIRYSPGDFATSAESPRVCGLRLPLLERLEGRTQTLSPLPSGRYSIAFSRIMSQFPEIARYQIVQQALDHFVVSIVFSSESSRELLNQIAQALGSKLGTDVRVEARAVEPTQLIGGPGKFRPVIPIAPLELGRIQ